MNFRRVRLSFIFKSNKSICGPGWLSRYSDWLRAGRSGDRIPVGRGFLHLSRPTLWPTQPPVQWVPALYRGVKSGRGVMLTPHPFQCRWSRKSRAIPLLPLWAIRPVQSLSACTRGALYLKIPTYYEFVLRVCLFVCLSYRYATSGVSERVYLRHTCSCPDTRIKTKGIKEMFTKCTSSRSQESQST